MTRMASWGSMKQSGMTTVAKIGAGPDGTGANQRLAPVTRHSAPTRLSEIVTPLARCAVARPFLVRMRSIDSSSEIGNTLTSTLAFRAHV